MFPPHFILIKMDLNLKKSSWENLIECIRDSEIKSKGNFWGSIQSLEEQLKEKNLDERINTFDLNSIKKDKEEFDYINN